MTVSGAKGLFRRVGFKVLGGTAGCALQGGRVTDGRSVTQRLLCKQVEVIRVHW